MTRIARAAVVLAVLAACLTIVACGSESEETVSASGASETTDTAKTAPTVPTIVVRDGEPVNGVAELDYDAGEQVRFRVRSDVADEIHVHGYDLAKDVSAGGTVAFSFPADIEGIFEVELEERGEQIAELRVEP